MRPPPPNADVQPQLTSVGCKKCGVHLSKNSADAYEGHCWKCFTFACKGCAGAISKTSFENLGGMCWKCYLKQADLQCVMPCKNLCAAHVACPNPRFAIKGSLYCDQCREKHEGRCRNVASKCAPCASTKVAQSKLQKFCSACAGETAGLLCLNYTNPKVSCGGTANVADGRKALFCVSCSDRVADPDGGPHRLCKNAAATTSPCTKPHALNLSGPAHGACLECAKEINAVAVKGPTTCLAPDCHEDFVLPHSKYCKQCILKKEPSILRIDERDTEAVLAIEREAVAGTVPQTQELPSDGDPFHLYLPRKHVDLPSYDSKPTYMPWNHCRICLETVPLQPGESWQDALSRHAQASHGMTWADMRRKVLETTMHDFPVPISAQTVRTTLDRFRRELSEENFTFFPCACCVRPFSAANLHDVVFPAEGAESLPAWLK